MLNQELVASSLRPNTHKYYFHFQQSTDLKLFFLGSWKGLVVVAHMSAEMLLLYRVEAFQQDNFLVELYIKRRIVARFPIST